MAEDEVLAYLREKFDSYSKSGRIDSVHLNFWALSERIRKIVDDLHPETLKRYYGEGLIIPEAIEELRVLDVGCGAGSLVFVLSRLVGERGSVVGVDLSPALISECKKFQDYHRQKWGYKQSNTEFLVSNMEDLSIIEDNAFDVIVSTGVISFARNRQKVFAEIFRLLKVGGEFCVTDTFTDLPLSVELKKDMTLWESGGSSAFTLDEFESVVTEAGFTSPYLTDTNRVDITEDCRQRLGERKFCSASFKMFRLDNSTTDSEMNSATVIYRGPTNQLKWDVTTTFKVGESVEVGREMGTILQASRFRKVFQITRSNGGAGPEKICDPFEHIRQRERIGEHLQCVYTIF